MSVGFGYELWKHIALIDWFSNILPRRLQIFISEKKGIIDY